MPTNTFFNLPIEKKEKIINAAKSEFVEYSFHDASINRIIKSAGISRGSFYMYFENKEELFLYILDGYREEALAEIRTFLTEKLDLELNQKTRYYPNKFGCNFCGYVIHEHYTLLRRRCIINIKRKMRKHNLNLKDFYGHLKHANCYNFIKKIQEECNRLDKLSKLEQK